MYKGRSMTGEVEYFEAGKAQNGQGQWAVATTVMNVPNASGPVTVNTMWEQGMAHITTLVLLVGAGGTIVHPLNDFDGTDPEVLKEENRRIVRLIQKEGLKGVNMNRPPFGT